MNKETALPTQVVYQQYPEREDEIDISALFNKLWLRRRFIISFVFVIGVIAAGILAAQLLLNAPEKRYSEILQFNFPAAEKGLYPSGQKFSYNDIVSAKVLEQVYRINDLASHNIKFEDFVDAITVSPFSENEMFIKEKYQALLSDKKLSRPEIESLEKVYLSELKIAQSRFVKLSFLESNLQGLDEVLINKILIDIPRVWSMQSIEELGVLDLKIVGANFYQSDLLDRFEYLQTLEYLKDSALSLKVALETLVKDEVGGFIRNAESGQTAVDLNINLKNMISFEIEPLFSTITNLGITKDAGKALIYLKNSIQNFQDKKAVLKSKALNIENIVQQYADSNMVNKQGSQEGSAGGFSQYDSTFLDKFTSMIEEKNDKAYKQGLLTQRLDVLQEIEDIDGQIIKFQRAEKRLLSDVDAISEEMRKNVIKEIGYARTNFEKLLAEYQRLLELRNRQVLGNTASLYQVTSNELIVETDIIARLTKILLFLVLASVIALMLAVVIALFRQTPELRQETGDAA